MTTSRPQATKANTAQVQQHIRRQRLLGQRLIGDSDRVRIIELVVTGAILITVCTIAYVRHTHGLMPF